MQSILEHVSKSVFHISELNQVQFPESLEINVEWDEGTVDRTKRRNIVTANK